MKNTFESEKDRMLGRVKETAGKILDNNNLEFKGKMQSMKAEIEDKASDLKEEMLRKTNDFIDTVQESRRDKK